MIRKFNFYVTLSEVSVLIELEKATSVAKYRLIKNVFLIFLFPLYIYITAFKWNWKNRQPSQLDHFMKEDSRIDLRPKTTNNKRMQIVLEKVGEVVYYIDTWSIAVAVCTEFYLMVMQGFFLPKTSIFESQFVYIQGLF